MIPVHIEYTAPERLADALKLLEGHGNAMVLAGGHSLLLKLRTGQVAPTLLVDLRNLPGLRGIRRTEGGGLELGAMTTLSELAASEEVRTSYPALYEAIEGLGDSQMRNRATIGGALASNDPEADLPAVALAFEAAVQTIGPGGGRTVRAEKFLIGPMKTSLSPGEIITSVLLPSPKDGSASAYERFTIPATGAALCGVAAVLTRVDRDGDGGVCRVALTGAADRAARLPRVEAALTGKTPTVENIAAAAEQVSDESLSYVSDFHASAEYRAHLTRVLVERAIARAAGRSDVSQPAGNIPGTPGR
jgi:carbon-monoxide dehydrogenase medium subunit